MTRVKAELKSGKILPLLCIFLLAALHSDEMCALLITVCFRITPKLNCSQEEYDIRNIFLLSMTSHQPINTEVPWSWSGILVAPAVVATNSSSCWTLERWEGFLDNGDIFRHLRAVATYQLINRYLNIYPTSNVTAIVCWLNPCPVLHVLMCWPALCLF